MTTASNSRNLAAQKDESPHRLLSRPKFRVMILGQIFDPKCFFCPRWQSKRLFKLKLSLVQASSIGGMFAPLEEK